jgi:hypothetical protein
MLNSIRFESSARLLSQGKAREAYGRLQKRGQLQAEHRANSGKGGRESSRMVREGRLGSWSEVKWGRRSGQEAEFTA